MTTLDPTSTGPPPGLLPSQEDSGLIVYPLKVDEVPIDQGLRCENLRSFEVVLIKYS